jgi:Tir chaperone family protein CesT
MATLDRTRALIADLAGVIGVPELPQDASGGYRLTIGEDDVLLYGGDDEQILVVAPIGKMPVEPDYAVVSYLLQANMFNSETMPFVIAMDDAGNLLQWAKLRIADFNGTTLATVLENLADRSAELRGELAEAPAAG